MKNVFILVDYQNDFVTGALGSEKAKELDEKILEKLKEAVKNNYQIYVTLDTHSKDTYLETSEGKHLPVEHCMIGTIGRNLYGKTGDFVYDNLDKIVFIHKDTFGSLDIAYEFENDILEDINIYICGVCTDICVLSNAVIAKSLSPYTEVYVYKDLCAGSTEEMHEKSLEMMKNLHINII